MLKFKRGKRLILSLICLMFAALTAFSCVCIKTNDKNNEPQAAGTYVFGTEQIKSNSDEYKNNDTFEVGSPDALKAFSLSVSYGNGKPCSFSGKTVKITSNMSVNYFLPIGGDENWYQYSETGPWYMGYDGRDEKQGFYGTFDGCGFTLNLKSNFESLSGQINWHWNGGGGNVNEVGLFAFLGKGAIVKNVRINYELKSYTIRDMFSFGAIAGTMDRATIENCFVESLVIKHAGNYFGKEIRCLAGLVGWSLGGTIRNCNVKDFKFDIVEEEDKVKDYVGTYGSSTFVSGITNFFGHDEDGYITEIEGCVVDNGEKNSSTVYDNWKLNVFTGVSTCEFDSYSVPITMSDANTSIILTDVYNDWEIGKKHFLNTDLWYIPLSEKFNNGWPYLRAFGKFSTYTFESGEGGTVRIGEHQAPRAIEIPDIYPDGTSTNCVDTLIDGEGPIRNFFDIPVVAEAEMGHYFVLWNYSSDTKTFFPLFGEKSFNFYFKIVDEQGNELPENEDLVAYEGSYTWHYDLELGKISSAQRKTVTDWKIGKYYVCTAPNKYELTGVTIEGLNFTSSHKIRIFDFGKNESSVTVLLTLKLREYNLEIK